MRTLFLGANAVNDLTPLIDKGMLTAEEVEMLMVALPGTRPLVITGAIR